MFIIIDLKEYNGKVQNSVLKTFQKHTKISKITAQN